MRLCLPLPSRTELNSEVTKGQHAHLRATEADGSQEPTSQHDEKHDEEEEEEEEGLKNRINISAGG